DDKTCPKPGVFAAHGVLKDSPGALPGGCTEDLVHRYYQEQYQLDGGRQDRYVAGSDAIGLAMGRYDTRALPIYTYLHAAGAPHYVIADHFFQAAFGGSFLNHQWLAAAATPTWPNAVVGGPNDLHSLVGADANPAGNVAGAGWTNGTTPGTCADPNAFATAVYPNCPDKLFQFHHQPFNYFANFAPGTAMRAAHLRDEVEFMAAAKAGTLKPVS